MKNSPFWQLNIDDEKQLLRDKGYWFYYTQGRIPGSPSLSSIARPLHKRAQYVALVIFLWPILSIAAMLGVPTIRSWIDGNLLLAIAVIIGPILFIRLLLWGKVYDGRRAAYKEENFGKRDGLYTSNVSLLTTDLTGTYLCTQCKTPLATTDDKLRVEEREVVVRQLFDGAVQEQDGTLCCALCGQAVGRRGEGVICLDGDQIALDANEVHFIYA